MFFYIEIVFLPFLLLILMVISMQFPKRGKKNDLVAAITISQCILYLLLLMCSCHSNDGQMDEAHVGNITNIKGVSLLFIL